MTTPANPIAADRAVAAALELVRAGACGRLLAVYAVARTRSVLADPLAELGLPLVATLLDGLHERPEAVTAVATRAEAGLAHWSLIVAFPSGLRASLDVGAGLARGQSAALDLRLEWTGTERAILVDPANVAVTVANEFTVERRSAEVTPIVAALASFTDGARRIAADPPGAWADAAAVISAARASVDTRARVRL